MAKLFDDLVQNRLDAARRKLLEANCKTTPQASVFCYGIINRDRFDGKIRQLEKDALPVRYCGPTYRPHFSKQDQLLNWTELRTAPLAGILRGLPKTSASKMSILKSAALRETECPNPAAIAIAAILEDRLPQKISFDLIGRLYEKGGRCMKDAPVEQEQVLTRAGLLYYASGNYPLAMETFQASASLPAAYAGRALYWLYRTQIQLGDSGGAKLTLDTLQNRYPFSFHGLVGQTTAGKDPGELLTRTPSTSSKRSRKHGNINFLLEEAEFLHRFGYNATASVVLDWATAMSRDLEPEVLLYIAEIKKEPGDYKSRIALLSDLLYQNPLLISRQTLEQYFPKVFFPLFEKQSSMIDPYFLLAVARRESAFDPNAISSANAKGLLQVLPATGRRWKKNPNLLDPETNVALGAKYLVELLKRTDGQVHLALAAYNAGLGKLRTWTRNHPTNDPILFIDLIPFRETREYVGSVLRNYYWYRRIYKADLPIPADKILEVAIVQ